MVLVTVLASQPIFAAGTRTKSNNAESKKTNKKSRKPSSTSGTSPSYPLAGFFSQIKYGAGIGVNIPDILPIEGLAFFNKYLAARLFFVPTIPFNIRVELPRDKLSSAGGIAVEHPDLDIKFRARYGPQYGAEVLVFPFADNFFLNFGTSYRRLTLKGGVESPLLLTATSTGTSTTTNTHFSIKTDAETSQIVTRLGAGWFWKVFGSGYLMLNFGYTNPRASGSKVDVFVNVRNPNATEEGATTQAFDQLKTKKEAEMSQKAKEAMKPAEKLALPIIGITFGVLF